MVLAGLLLRGMAITPLSSGYLCGAPLLEPVFWIATNPASMYRGKDTWVALKYNMTLIPATLRKSKRRFPMSRKPIFAEDWQMDCAKNARFSVA